MGLAYEQKDKLEKAVDALKEGMHKAKEMGSGLCLRIIFKHLGSCFRSMKDYWQAEEYFEASLTLARSLISEMKK